MTVVDFARALPCSRENAYKLFHKDNIDVKQLERICQVLEYDFLRICVSVSYFYTCEQIRYAFSCCSHLHLLLLQLNHFCPLKVVDP